MSGTKQLETKKENRLRVLHQLMAASLRIFLDSSDLGSSSCQDPKGYVSPR
jgi:hypothetical protein